MYISTKKSLLARPVAAVLAGSLIMPTLSGCGGGGTATPPPPADATRGQAPMRPNTGAAPRTGMSSTQKKLVVLAGAAAMYYLYKKRQSQNAQAGQKVQYYRSKNGRIYYRNPQTKQAIWVTPELSQVKPMQVPASEVEAYRNYRGYNNNTTGTDPTQEIPLFSGG